MGKPTRDPAEEVREATREAHEVLQDLAAVEKRLKGVLAEIAARQAEVFEVLRVVAKEWFQKFQEDAARLVAEQLRHGAFKVICRCGRSLLVWDDDAPRTCPACGARFVTAELAAERVGDRFEGDVEPSIDLGEGWFSGAGR